MPTLFPFAALLPCSGEAKQIASLPYDVMNRQEARRMVEGNPLSYLRVTLADLELPDSVSSYDQQVYERAAANLADLQERGDLEQDARPSFYLYSLVMDGRRQTGIVACVSVKEYNEGIVRRHELTRKEKEDDRTKHILSTGAQTGPVFLAYRDCEEVDSIVERVMAEEKPLFDFVAEDGIGHTGWRIPAGENDRLATLFQTMVPMLYIADGHHRAAAASRSCQQLEGAGESGRTMGVIFPSSQLRILAYNRVVKDLNGLSADEFLTQLSLVGDILPEASPVPEQAGQVSFYLGGKWMGLAFRDCHPEDPIENLDVSLLQNQVLSPILGIQDPRRDPRIDFVGGIRGTAELEKRVDAGEAIAFSLYPTSMDQLLRVADANGIMPPKSTWFEPKLRDGLFTHLIR